MVKKDIDIHIIDGKYYNYNGKNPDKPLSNNYGKRLYKVQQKYGFIPIKEASGKGNLQKKSVYFLDLNKSVEKEDRTEINIERKKDVLNLNEIDFKLLKSLNINPLDVRTRFRSGFKIYEDGKFSYDTFSYAKAYDGIIPLKRFLDNVPSDMFDKERIDGGFKYVIYNKKTKHVYHEIEYTN